MFFFFMLVTWVHIIIKIYVYNIIHCTHAYILNLFICTDAYAMAIRVQRVKDNTECVQKYKYIYGDDES